MIQRITYTILGLLLSLNIFAAETIVLDFETSTAPSSVSSWTNYSKSGAAASVWSTPNPKPDAINGTANSYKITKRSDDPYWTGLEVTLATAIPITTANQYLHVFVYKNSNSRIALTYTPLGGNQSSDVWQTYDITGQWIDYVLPIPVGTNLKSFAIKIADDAGDYYFDQIVLSDNGASQTRRTVSINPTLKGQTIEGWGASLCWWANIMGGYTDARIKTMCDWITDPVNGLNMNIFRFNIGGGDDPTHNHMRSDGGNMPGYKASAEAPYDWTQDANQRKILQQLIASRIAKAGVNDIQIVGFSNSPPYWMTVSGCSAGSVTGNVTNLKSDMFDDFADYLTEVTKYYHDQLGITFNYLEPFNEPDANWWKALGGQEGCYFSTSEQMTVIRELYKKLEEKDMLGYCSIAANDANNFDNGYNALLAYQNAGDILPKIGLAAVHSYYGSGRSSLANWASAQNKKLWQSESGPLYVGTTYESQVMIMADRIITDLRDMNCTAWCDWQIGGTGGLSNAWGLIMSEYSDQTQPIARNTNFYMRAQYSRYLKTGYTIVGTNLPNSLAAISPDEKELIVIISNSNTYTQRFSMDLSTLTDLGTKAQQIRTRAQESLGIKNSLTVLNITGNTLNYDALSESVATFKIPINQTPTAVERVKKPLGDVVYTSGFLSSSIETELPLTLKVFNTSGQLVNSSNNFPAKGDYRIELKRGIYFVNVSSANFTLSRKILVQ
jgi:O-glycosyl hydrolase